MEQIVDRFGCHAIVRTRKNRIATVSTNARVPGACEDLVFAARADSLDIVSMQADWYTTMPLIGARVHWVTIHPFRASAMLPILSWGRVRSQ